MLLLRKIAAAFGLTVLSLAACSRQPDPHEIAGSDPACAMALAALDTELDPDSPQLFRWRLEPFGPGKRWHASTSELLSQRALWERLGKPQYSMWQRFEREQRPWYALRQGRQTAVSAPGPSLKMVQALLAATPVDASTCPGVHAYAASAGALRPRRASRALYETIFRVERAVLSPNGDEAIVYVASGVGSLIYYRKQADGRWHEAARTQVWVS